MVQPLLGTEFIVADRADTPREKLVAFGDLAFARAAKLHGVVFGPQTEEAGEAADGTKLTVFVRKVVALETQGALP